MYHAGHLSVNLKIAKGQLILTPKNIHDFTSWVLPSPPLPSPPRSVHDLRREKERLLEVFSSFTSVFLSVIRTFVLIFHSHICSFVFTPSGTVVSSSVTVDQADFTRSVTLVAATHRPWLIFLQVGSTSKQKTQCERTTHPPPL